MCLNIPNIENDEIKYIDMDKFLGDEGKIKRYELLRGDVILSCGDTVIKSAVFESKTIRLLHLQI